MTTPVEEYFRTKTATSLPEGIGSKLRGLMGNAAMGAATGAAMGAGSAMLSVGAAKIYDAITKSHNFKQMMEVNPDLQEHFQQNPKFFNQAFSSLRSANPSFSKDPLIAGTYMRRMMDSPEGAGGMLESAMGQASHGQRPVLEAFGRGALEGAKSGLSAKK